jgi:hypothetical protein
MEMSKMYELVFQDIVKTYLENLEEDKIEMISVDDIKDIAYKLIYKNEYVWEIINETIDTYINNIIYENERGN